MKLPIHLLLIFLINLFLIITPVYSKFDFFDVYCSDDIGNYTTPSTFKTNLDLLLPDLTKKASLSLFDTQTIEDTGIDQINGLYMCRGDLDVQQCQECVATASSEIVLQCPEQKQAIIWYQQCMVRYSNRTIFSLEDESRMSYSWSDTNVSNPAVFGDVISKTVDGVIAQAAYNTSSKGYAFLKGDMSLIESVYVMGQCTPDILGSGCERCLRVAFRNMGACCGTARLYMSMYLPSCVLRYASAPFVGQSDTSSPVPSSPEFHSSSQGNNILPFDLLPSLPLPPPLPPSTGQSSSATTTYGGISLMFMLSTIVTMLLSLMW